MSLLPLSLTFILKGILQGAAADDMIVVEGVDALVLGVLTLGIGLYDVFAGHPVQTAVVALFAT